jgi:hypothetical protein
MDNKENFIFEGQKFLEKRARKAAEISLNSKRQKKKYKTTSSLGMEQYGTDRTPVSGSAKEKKAAQGK